MDEQWWPTHGLSNRLVNQKEYNSYYMRNHASFEAIDIETTGLDPETDCIIQIAVVILNYCDDNYICYHSFIKPCADFEVDKDSTQIHGITTQHLNRARTFYEVWKDIQPLIIDCVLVGEDILSFDLKFICRELEREGDLFDLQNGMIVIKNISAIKENVHSGFMDCIAMLEKLPSLLQKYKIPTQLDGLQYMTGIQAEESLELIPPMTHDNILDI
ncbi:MAG TPA: 3'-5' exonuclease [Legionellaceae bacterium]|nr:3'-5' exonuclease [Legionellaceae bacterium]